MNARSLFLLAIAPLFFAVSCSDDTPDGGSGQADAVVNTDAGEPAEAGFPDATRIDAGRIDAGRIDAGNPPDAGGDNNDDFDTAEEAPINDMNGLEGVIDPAGDMDYAKVELPAAGFWIFFIEANPDGLPDNLDSVITLYDSEREQVAQNDDTIFNRALDSEIIYHVPAAGTYYVRVQDYSTFGPDQTPRGDPGLTYSLFVFQLANGTAEITTIDPETGDNAASAHMMVTNQGGFGMVMGTFRDANDVDVYSVTIPGTAVANYSIEVMPDGPNGFGSTPTGLVRVTDVDGSTIARANISLGFTAVEPSVEGGDQLLIHVAHPGGTAGANDFYVIKVFPFEENPPKTVAEPANNTLMGAEALTLDTTLDPPAVFISGHIEDGDEDYFSVDIADGETLTVACGSASSGSGIIDLSLEVLTSTGGAVAAAREMPPDNLFLETNTATGTLYLRFFKVDQDPEVSGNWMRCGIRAITE